MTSGTSGIGSVRSVPNPNVSTEFKKILSAFSSMAISQDECIENCTRYVGHFLESNDCDLSATSQKMVNCCLNNFDQTVNGMKCFSAERATHLKEAFNRSFCEVVVIKWSVVMAESFRSILTSNREGQIAAMQNWTHKYFVAVDGLEKISLVYRGKNRAKLRKKTLKSFRMIEKRTGVLEACIQYGYMLQVCNEPILSSKSRTLFAKTFTKI
jgi:hypothetical protein